MWLECEWRHGSDGLRIWVFWKTRQLGFYWEAVQLIVEGGPVELGVDLGHEHGL